MENHPLSFIDKAAIWILIVCITVFLTAVGYYLYDIITQSSQSVQKINIVLDEPTLKSDSTLYAKEGIDSLMKMVAHHEQALSDKYQYMLEQKEKDETMFSLAGSWRTVLWHRWQGSCGETI